MSAVNTFQLSPSGLYVPFVKEAGRLQQVVAAPMPGPQLAFLSACEKEVGLIGNRGGGKSEALVMDALSGVGRGYGANYKAVILRSSLREMTDLVTMIDAMVKPIWSKAVSYNRLNHVYEWRSGETLELNYFVDMSTFSLYQGKSLSFLGWEELTLQKNLQGYLAMFSCLRSAMGDAMPRKVRFTANPGGPSHNAVKFRFRLHGIPEGICGPCITDENGETRRVIHCSFDDNSILRRQNRDTWRASRRRAKATLRNCRLGSMVIGHTAGGALDDVFFKYGKSIFVEPFQLPAEGKLFMSYDHGSSKPYCALFWWESNGCDIQFNDGRTKPTRPGDLFMIGEVYGSTGEPDKGTHESIGEITTRIQQYKIARGWRYRDPLTQKWMDIFRRGYADSAIGEEMNEFSVAEEFKVPVVIDGIQHPGISWELVTKPPGSRVTGFQLLRERLIICAPRADSKVREGKGMFIVKDDCPNVVRTLPILQRAKNNLDDVDSAGEDHAFDAARYALMADRTPHVSFRRRTYW